MERLRAALPCTSEPLPLRTHGARQNGCQSKNTIDWLSHPSGPEARTWQRDKLCYVDHGAGKSRSRRRCWILQGVVLRHKLSLEILRHTPMEL